MKRFDLIPFDEVLIDSTGGNDKILQSDYLKKGLLPIIDQGEDFIGGYTDDLSLKYSNQLPCIVFGDHTKILKYIDFDFALGADGTKVLLTKNGFDPKFIFYYLHTFRFPVNVGYSRHFKFLKEVKIPKLDLDYQVKCRNVLDKADAIRKKRRETIRLADEFLRSTFLEMFGDPVISKKNKVLFTKFVEINPKKSELNGIDENIKVTFLPMANVSDDGNIITREEKKYGEVKNGFTYFSEGDVLFAKITPCMENGKGAIADKLTNGIGFGSTEFHVLRPINYTTRSWLLFLLRNKNLRLSAEKNMTGSAGQKRVPGSFFENLLIPEPSNNNMQKFYMLYEKSKNLKQKYEQSLQEAENLFNSLMQRAFRGEL